MLKYKNLKYYLFLFIGLFLLIASINPKGSWSYFNDIELIPNAFAVGMCLFEANSEDLNYNLTNMFPDETDNKQININFKNTGSFFLNHLYFDTVLDFNAYDGNQNKAKQFAEQFKVNFFKNNVKLNQSEWNIAQLANANLLDIGQWLPSKGVYVGDEFDLTMTITFIESNNVKNKEFEDKILPVSFLLEGICGDGGNGEDNWDKSSLSFTGSSGKTNSSIFATIKNGGSKDMNGPVTYEVYWATNGNPKNGSIVATGNIPALNSGQSFTITYNTTNAGVYMFKAYQRPAHPGQGVLWSDSITVK